MNRKAVRLEATCPDCDFNIEFDQRPRIDDTVVCPNCSALLEVVSVNPLELSWAYEDDYQYDDDFEDADDSEYEEYGDYEDYDDDPDR